MASRSEDGSAFGLPIKASSVIAGTSRACTLAYSSTELSPGRFGDAYRKTLSDVLPRSGTTEARYDDQVLPGLKAGNGAQRWGPVSHRQICAGLPWRVRASRLRTTGPPCQSRSWLMHALSAS